MAEPDSSSATPMAKIPRMDAGESGDSVNGGSDSKRFSNFMLKRVLNENSSSKMICVEGRFGESEDPAIVILQKTPFTQATTETILSDTTETKQEIDNDIYSSLQVKPLPQYNSIQASIVYPATQKHIDKYSAQEMYIVDETPDDYSSITLPYIESEQFRIQWVYNILEKKTESDRIVFEDPDPETGFILLPDMKWDGKQVEDLYLCAIVHKHGIKSIRELSAEHLPLLKNIYEKGIIAIQNKFQVPKSKLRIYLHYQPSYYHLHVHFTHLSYDAPGSGVERAHLLSDVINDIELDAEYYKKKTLTFTVKANQGLCKKYQDAGKI